MPSRKQQPGPDDLVTVRRRAGYGDVSVPALGIIVREGETMPMRFEEASARDDFEIVGDNAPAEEE